MEFYKQFFFNHPIIILGWCACVLGIIFTYIQDKMLGIKPIGNSLVAVICDKENGVVLDLRPLAEFRKGHILGSLHILPSDIDTNNLGKIANHKEKPIILTNEYGNNLQASAKQLKKLGFTNIYILQDGISGWLTDNLPLSKK